MRRILIQLTIAAIACAGSMFASSAVFLNTTNDTGSTLLYNPQFTQLGDQIALAGTDRVAVFAMAQLFNQGTAGTVDVTLRLFNVGAPVASQIGGDFMVSGVSAPGLGDPQGGVFNVGFNLPNLGVPDNLIFTVQVSNPSRGVDIQGVNLFDPPTVGS